jgi:hypothetical protein
MFENSTAKKYTPAEFAALFGRHPSWGYRRIYAGAVGVLSGSLTLLIPQCEVDRFSSEVVRHEKSKQSSLSKPRTNSRNATRRRNPKPTN